MSSTGKEEHRLQQLLNTIDRLEELGDWSERLGIDRNAIQLALEEAHAQREAEEAERREVAAAQRQALEQSLHAEREADAAAEEHRRDFQNRLDEILGKR